MTPDSTAISIASPSNSSIDGMAELNSAPHCPPGPPALEYACATITKSSGVPAQPAT